MNDKYLEEIKVLTEHLHKDYQNALHDYYFEYIENKRGEGLGKNDILKGMADPSVIAERWDTYVKLNNIKGQKNLKEAKHLIKKALLSKMLPISYYYLKLMILLIKIIVGPVFIATLCVLLTICSPVLGTFIVVTIKLNYPELIFILLIAIFILLFSISIKFIIRSKKFFLNDMIEYLIARYNLHDFNK